MSILYQRNELMTFLFARPHISIVLAFTSKYLVQVVIRASFA